MIPGFSDHSIDNFSSTAAVVCGAKVIERHYTISRSLPGIDQPASLEPNEFKNLREIIDNIYLTLGDEKQLMRKLLRLLKVFHKA